jgi:transcriptional regulator with XRE-family HTH domain
MSLISVVKLNLTEKLKRNRAFRKKFFETTAKEEVAAQIRELRRRRKMRQADLAKATHMKQSAVSRLEQANYSRWSFTTLLRVADSLDARVKVTFQDAQDVITEYERGDKERVQMALAFEKANLSGCIQDRTGEQLSRVQDAAAAAPQAILGAVRYPNEDWVRIAGNLPKNGFSGASPTSAAQESGLSVHLP